LRSAFHNPRPGITQSHRPIEDQRPRPGIRIDTEIAEPFKLIVVARLHSRQTWLHPARSYNLKRIRIQIGLEVFAAFFIHRIFSRKQPVIKPGISGDQVLRGNSVQRRFRLWAAGRIPGQRSWIILAMDFDYFSFCVLHTMCACNEIGIPQADRPPGGQPEEFLGRILEKILVLDEQLSGKWYVSSARRQVLRIIDCRHLFNTAFRKVVYYQS
jgi:hypothetical protein